MSIKYFTLFLVVDSFTAAKLIRSFHLCDTGVDVALIIATVSSIAIIALILVLLLGTAIIIKRRMRKATELENENPVYEEIGDYQSIALTNGEECETMLDDNHGYEKVQYDDQEAEHSSSQNLLEASSLVEDPHEYERMDEIVRIFDVFRSQLYDQANGIAQELSRSISTTRVSLHSHEGVKAYYENLTFPVYMDLSQVMDSSPAEEASSGLGSVYQRAPNIVVVSAQAPSTSDIAAEAPGVDATDDVPNFGETHHESAWTYYERVPNVDISHILTMARERGLIYERVPIVDIALLLSNATDKISRTYERVPMVDIAQILASHGTGNRNRLTTAEEVFPLYERAPNVDIAQILHNIKTTPQ